MAVGRESLTREQAEERVIARRLYRQQWWLLNRDRVLAHRKAKRAEGYGQKGKYWVAYPKDWGGGHEL